MAPDTGTSRIILTGTGFSAVEKAVVQAKASELGCVYNGDLVCGVTTHLVCRSVLSAVNSAKYVRSLQWGIKVVSYEWLLDSAAAGKPLPTADYKTDRQNSQPILTPSNLANIPLLAGPSVWKSSSSSVPSHRLGAHKQYGQENQQVITRTQPRSETARSNAPVCNTVHPTKPHGMLAQSSSQEAPEFSFGITTAHATIQVVPDIGNKSNDGSSPGTPRLQANGDSVPSREAQPMAMSPQSIRVGPGPVAVDSDSIPPSPGNWSDDGEEGADYIIPGTQAMDGDDGTDECTPQSLISYIRLKASNGGTSSFWGNHNAAPDSTAAGASQALAQCVPAAAGDGASNSQHQEQGNARVRTSAAFVTPAAPSSPMATSPMPPLSNADGPACTTQDMDAIDAMLVSPAPGEEGQHHNNARAARTAAAPALKLQLSALLGAPGPAPAPVSLPLQTNAHGRPAADQPGSPSPSFGNHNPSTAPTPDTSQGSADQRQVGNGRPSILYSGFGPGLSDVCMNSGQPSPAQAASYDGPVPSNSPIVIGSDAGCSSGSSGLVTVGKAGPGQLGVVAGSQGGSGIAYPGSDSRITKRRPFRAIEPTGFTPNTGDCNQVVMAGTTPQGGIGIKAEPGTESEEGPGHVSGLDHDQQEHSHSDVIQQGEGSSVSADAASCMIIDSTEGHQGRAGGVVDAAARPHRPHSSHSNIKQEPGGPVSGLPACTIKRTGARPAASCSMPEQLQNLQIKDEADTDRDLNSTGSGCASTIPAQPVPNHNVIQRRGPRGAPAASSLQRPAHAPITVYKPLSSLKEYVSLILHARHTNPEANTAVETLVIKSLARPPKGTQIKEHHSLPSLKGVDFSEQVELQLLGGAHKMAFTCKDKAKRMVAPVVVTVEATGQRSMSVAEPFAVYRLPDGEWWMEYYPLLQARSVAEMARAQGKELEQLPPDFGESYELLRVNTHTYSCRVSDIVGDVTVSRAKRAPVQARKGQSVPPLVAQDIPTVLEAMSCLEMQQRFSWSAHDGLVYEGEPSVSAYVMDK